MAHSVEKRIARLEAEQGARPAGDQDDTVRFPDPPPCGQTVITAIGLCKGTAGRRSSKTSGSTSAAASGCSCSGSTAPARRACCGSSPGRPSRPRRLRLRLPGARRLLRAGARQPRSRPSLLDNIRDAVPTDVNSPRPSCGACSGCSGCRATRSSRRPGTLSGGEKTKLALAMLMVGRNNLLLLDEPTNNLDPPSRQAVADALVDWPGAIIFVSHDTEFVPSSRRPRCC